MPTPDFKPGQEVDPYAKPASVLPPPAVVPAGPKPPWWLRVALWLGVRACALFVLSIVVTAVLAKESLVQPRFWSDIAPSVLPVLLLAMAGWVGLARRARWSPWAFALILLELLWQSYWAGGNPIGPLFFGALFCLAAGVGHILWERQHRRSRLPSGDARPSG